MRSAADFDPSDKWFGQQAVYRISMGNFLFFGVLSLALLGVKHKNDKRDQLLHHGNWLVKLGLWLLFSALPFFFPNNIVMGYAWLARFGSGIFLVIQMIILLDFTQSWNDAWVAKGEDNQNWLYGLLAITIGAYVAVIILAGVLFYWFKPFGAGSCSLNVGLITLSLLLCVAFSVLTLHPSAQNGSLFPAACISLYCMYLCYSALQSEPRDYPCNGLAVRLTAASGSTLVVGMLLTLASVVYSAFRAGSNTNLFMLDEDDVEATASTKPLLEETTPLTSSGLDGLPEGTAPALAPVEDKGKEGAEVTYNYSFFHLIFALASMYVAMLMTGWGAVEQEKDRIDVGWTAVWVKFGSEWVTAALYSWSLLAPLLFPDRTFG